MNDWLDYKGSGSARAYTANGLVNESNISHGLRNFTKREEELLEIDKDIKRREERKNVEAYLKEYNNYVNDVIQLNRLYRASESKYKAARNAEKAMNEASNGRGGSARVQALESAFKSLKSESIRTADEYAKKYKEFKQKYDRDKMEVRRAYYYDLYGSEYTNLAPGKISQLDSSIVMPYPFDRWK